MDQLRARKVSRMYLRKIAARHPDKEWAKGDPEAPVLGYDRQKLIKLWSLVPDVVGAAFTDKGQYLLLITKKGMGMLPDRVKRVHLDRTGDYRIAREVYMGSIFYEMPKWKSLYEQATGQTPTSYLVEEHRTALIEEGVLGFKSSTDVLPVLRRQGWQEPSDKTRKKVRKDKNILAKRIQGVWVWIMDSRWDLKRMLLVSSRTPKGISALDDEKWKEYREATQREIRDVTKVTVTDIERLAGEVAVAVKSFTPKRKRTTYEDFEWGNQEGPEAYKAWLIRVKEILVAELKSSAEYHKRQVERGYSLSSQGSTSTSSLSQNVLNNYGMMPAWGMSRKEAQLKIRAILEKLAKEGKVEKITGYGRELYWEYIL